jgi:hypothetical protein
VAPGTGLPASSSTFPGNLAVWANPDRQDKQIANARASIMLHLISVVFGLLIESDLNPNLLEKQLFSFIVFIWKLTEINLTEKITAA